MSEPTTEGWALVAAFGDGLNADDLAALESRVKAVEDEAATRERDRLRAKVIVAHGGECVDDGSGVCATHFELIFDNGCEDSPAGILSLMVPA